MYKVLYGITVSNGIGEPLSEGASVITSETPNQTFFSITIPSFFLFFPPLYFNITDGAVNEKEPFSLWPLCRCAYMYFYVYVLFSRQ